MAAMDHFNENPVAHTWSYKLKKGRVIRFEPWKRSARHPQRPGTKMGNIATLSPYGGRDPTIGHRTGVRPSHTMTVGATAFS